MNYSKKSIKMVNTGINKDWEGYRKKEKLKLNWCKNRVMQ